MSLSPLATAKALTAAKVAAKVAAWAAVAKVLAVTTVSKVLPVAKALWRVHAGGRRRSFEFIRQPAGVIFEPGKCITCGICVEIAAQSREPLGLTFIGRGFDVRVGVPLGRSLDDALQLVAEECVRHCPTGALAFEQDNRNAVKE